MSSTGSNQSEQDGPTDSSDGDDYGLNHLFGNDIDVASSSDASSDDDENLPPAQHTFTWQDIFDGTERLKGENVLGRGAFGTVYRCNFPRIDQVGAAKIPRQMNSTRFAEFQAEIETLERATHENVITLLGKCDEREHHVIVYDLMPRGSLDQHFFARATLSPDSPDLSWERRMKIAVGVAEALVYVHNNLGMVHRDVKSANVLIDENFVPKLTDFGLAVKIDTDKEGNEKPSEVDSNKGTPGYKAPETEQRGLVLTKSDVYSYGVFLFHLLTGKKADDPQRRIGQKITDWMRLNCAGEENLPNVIDAALKDRYSFEGLKSLYAIAKMCTETQAADRPDMAQVVELVREAAGHVPIFL